MKGKRLERIFEPFLLKEVYFVKKIVPALSKGCDILAKIMEAVLAAILAVMVAIMFLQIVLRAGLKTTLVWGEEMLRYLFIIDTFIGASVCLYHGDLSRFELISDKLSPRNRRILFTFIDIVIIALLCLTASGAVTLVGRQMSQLGTSVKIPMGYIYLAIPLSCVTGVFFLVVNNLKAWFPPKEEK